MGKIALALARTRLGSRRFCPPHRTIFSVGLQRRALCASPAARHHLPPRLLEPVLQALVRQGILRGTRGPRGGYELARDRRRITADDILRAARTVEHEGEPAVIDFPLLREVFAPALAEAETAFSDALARISVEDLAHSATTLHEGQG